MYVLGAVPGDFHVSVTYQQVEVSPGVFVPIPNVSMTGNLFGGNGITIQASVGTGGQSGFEVQVLGGDFSIGTDGLVVGGVRIL